MGLGEPISAPNKSELHRSPQRLRYSARVPSSKETPQITIVFKKSCVEHISGQNITIYHPDFSETS